MLIINFTNMVDHTFHCVFVNYILASVIGAKCNYLTLKRTVESRLGNSRI